MSSLINIYLNAMTKDDELFFKKLGRRVTTYRKEQHLTQVQLAEALGVSQQHLGSFEKGIRKIPASMLPILATIFAVSTDDLLGITTKQAAKRGPTPKLQRQVELIAQLPKTKQKFVTEMLETVLQQASS